MEYKQEIHQRIKKLRKLINYHRYLYHVLDRQEISDTTLDALKHELFLLEQKYPEFITLDSPTQRIGGKPLKKFKKVQHKQPMLSIEDIFDKKELEDWEKYLKRLIPGQKFDYFAEMKIDGFAIALIYKNGVFFQGSTRGDGKIGEDVTQNLKTIESIPLKLEISKCRNIEMSKYQYIEVRGEVYMEKKDFERFNQERKKTGKPIYSNPRNLAAGSIRQLNPKIAAQRPLKFLAYDLITNLGQTCHSQEHKILQELGFKTDLGRKCQSLSEIIDYWQKIEKGRERFKFQIDGIVISVDNNALFQRLGVIGKSSRANRALKFSGKQAITQVQEIKLQVGRTGAITPVACLKPIQIQGVFITRATLHNEDEIKRLGVKIGDTVIIERTGDVIPSIVKVLKELRTDKEKEFEMPKFCPSCHNKLFKPEGEVIWKCLDSNCQARQKRYFYHFVSKKGFDIEGLGPKIIDQLFEQGLINSPADLFELKQEDLIPLERFAEKSSENLIKAIQQKKEIRLAKFIYALGIPGVGEETALSLADRFKKLEEFEKASLIELQNLKDIGPKTANSIYSYLKKNRNFIENLKDVGIKIIEPEISEASGVLQGKKFVFTGALSSLTREEAKQKIQKLGGRVAESVSKDVNFLILGKNPSSKLQKAKRLGIKILNQEEFLDLLKFKK